MTSDTGEVRSLGSWLRGKIGSSESRPPIETDYSPLTGDARIIAPKGNGGVRSDLLRAEFVGEEYESSVGVAAGVGRVSIDVEVNESGWDTLDGAHVGALAQLDPEQARRVASNLEAAADLIERHTDEVDE